jgi:hypothetical protein
VEPLRFVLGPNEPEHCFRDGNDAHLSIVGPCRAQMGVLHVHPQRRVLGVAKTVFDLEATSIEADEIDAGKYIEV